MLLLSPTDPTSRRDHIISHYALIVCAAASLCCLRAWKSRLTSRRTARGADHYVGSEMMRAVHGNVRPSGLPEATLQDDVSHRQGKHGRYNPCCSPELVAS